MAEYQRTNGLVQSDAFYLISPSGKAYISDQWKYVAASLKSLRPFFESREVEGQDWDARLRGIQFGTTPNRRKWRIYSDQEHFYVQFNTGTENDPNWDTSSVFTSSGLEDQWGINREDFYFSAPKSGSASHSKVLNLADTIYPRLVVKQSDEKHRTDAATLIFDSQNFYLDPHPTNPNAITVGMRGIQAEVEAVLEGESYLFTQAVPAVEWIVPHNLGTSAVFHLVTNNDDRIIQPDEVDLSDQNTAYFYFTSAITGKVRAARALGAGAITNISTIDISDGDSLYADTDELNVNPNRFYLSATATGKPMLNFIDQNQPITIRDGTRTYASALGANFAHTHFYLSESSNGNPTVNLRTESLPFSAKSVSSNQALNVGGVVTWAHGLGQEPTLIALKLVCVVAEHSFSVGDVVGPMSSFSNRSNTSVARSFTTRVDSTNVYIDHEIGTIVVDKGGSPQVSLTDGNWRWRITAWI